MKTYTVTATIVEEVKVKTTESWIDVLNLLSELADMHRQSGYKAVKNVIVNTDEVTE